MIKLACLMAGFSFSLLTACSSEDLKLSQQSEMRATTEVIALVSEAQQAAPELPRPSLQVLQAELIALQERLQTTEAALAQAQATLGDKDGQLQAFKSEQPQWSQQQANLDSSTEQIHQLEQQLSEQAQTLTQVHTRLIQAESECQQATLSKPDPKQLAGLDSNQVER